MLLYCPIYATIRVKFLDPIPADKKGLPDRAKSQFLLNDFTENITKTGVIYRQPENGHKWRSSDVYIRGYTWGLKMCILFACMCILFVCFDCVLALCLLFQANKGFNQSIILGQGVWTTDVRHPP